MVSPDHAAGDGAAAVGVPFKRAGHYFDEERRQSEPGRISFLALKDYCQGRVLVDRSTFSRDGTSSLSDLDGDRGRSDCGVRGQRSRQ